MKETKPVTFQVNTFNRVVTKFSSQGLNFEKEIKALALLSSLPPSWEVFCTSFANNSPKLTLDEAIKTILSEDIRHRSMGLTVDDNAEAHFLAETA